MQTPFGYPNEVAPLSYAISIGNANCPLKSFSNYDKPSARDLRCGRGEIGKHKGLKIPRLNRLTGSSPVVRTNQVGFAMSFFEAIAAKADELNLDPQGHLDKVHRIVTQLEAFLSGDNTLSGREIRELVKVLTSYTILAPISIPLTSGTTFTRARRCKTQEDKGVFKRTTDLSYISDKTVPIHAGRLNREQEAVYYGCIVVSDNSIGTALSEINAEKGKCYNLLYTSTKVLNSFSPTSTVNLVPIGLFDYFRREVNPPWQLSKTFMSINAELRKALHPAASIAMQLCDAFLADVLSRPSSSDRTDRLYSVSSKIGIECMMSPEIDGLVYPSTKLLDYPNVAIKPTSVDQYLSHKSAIAVRVHETYGYGMFRYSIYNEGTVFGEDIDWRLTPDICGS